MTEGDKKLFLINSYFEGIERRIAFLDELVESNHEDEAFLLCSVYIESLANRYYQNYCSSKGFCTALIDITKNKLFSLIHPKQFVKTLESNKLFDNNIDEIIKILEPLNNQLQTLENINKLLITITNKDQKQWLKDYWFKSSMAMIIYERIRCEAVHDMWVKPLSFSATSFNGAPVPVINYDLLKSALNKIVIYLKETSLKERNLFLQHNA